MGEYGAMTPEQRQGLINTAVDLFGGVDVGPIGAIKASHGSPHLFDRFDFSKIGTGEGAQAYGHGGYFAQGFDSPVAKAYRSNLVKNPTFIETKTGKLITPDSPDYPDLIERQERMERNGYGAEFDKKYQIQNGALYNVELKWPDAAREAADPLSEQHLLDWDASLSEQPEYVQQAFEKADAKRGLLRNYSRILDPEDKWTRGGDAYSDLAFALNDSVTKRGSTATDNSHKVVSNYLRELGIPGIKYLDASSRGTGTGTRNYVMFDDRFPTIVTRNGVSLTDLLKNK